MYQNIFDTHSHYTDAAFDADREQVLASLPEKGVSHAMLAACNLRIPVPASSWHSSTLICCMLLSASTRRQKARSLRTICSSLLSLQQQTASKPSEKSAWTIIMKAIEKKRRCGSFRNKWILRNSCICLLLYIFGMPRRMPCGF